MVLELHAAFRCIFFTIHHMHRVDVLHHMQGWHGSY